MRRVPEEAKRLIKEIKESVKEVGTIEGDLSVVFIREDRNAG